jgi:hypothetical protein
MVRIDQCECLGQTRSDGHGRIEMKEWNEIAKDKIDEAATASPMLALHLITKSGDAAWEIFEWRKVNVSHQIPIAINTD